MTVRPATPAEITAAAKLLPSGDGLIHYWPAAGAPHVLRDTVASSDLKAVTCPRCLAAVGAAPIIRTIPGSDLDRALYAPRRVPGRTYLDPDDRAVDDDLDDDDRISRPGPDLMFVALAIAAAVPAAGVVVVIAAVHGITAALAAAAGEILTAAAAYALGKVDAAGRDRL